MFFGLLSHVGRLAGVRGASSKQREQLLTMYMCTV